MNKKGFTLIELIGVIAVIAILGLVTIPIIMGVLSSNAENLDENQEKLIISAAKNYAIKNAFKLGDNNCVEVSQLKSQGFLDNISIENHSKNVNYNNYKVIIFKNEVTGNYEYKAEAGAVS